MQVPITLDIDDDACQEVYRVAERHARKGVATASLPYSVMAGLVPAIHVFAGGRAVKTWMPAT